MIILTTRETKPVRPLWLLITSSLSLVTTTFLKTTQISSSKQSPKDPCPLQLKLTTQFSNCTRKVSLTTPDVVPILIMECSSLDTDMTRVKQKITGS